MVLSVPASGVRWTVARINTKPRNRHLLSRPPCRETPKGRRRRTAGVASCELRLDRRDGRRGLLGFSIALACELLSVGIYDGRPHPSWPMGARERRQRWLLAAIVVGCIASSRRHGSLRIHAAVVDPGWRLSINRIATLMAEAGNEGRLRRRRRQHLTPQGTVDEPRYRSGRGDDRRRGLGHGAATVWFTGLSVSGKSTIAYAVEQALIAGGIAASVLVGDNVRHGPNRDLGFAPDDRQANIRRVGDVCRLSRAAGLIVLSSFISPYWVDHDRVRTMHPWGGFHEFFVATPLELCEQRDITGPHARARAGDSPDLSGVAAPYEPPDRPELMLDTSDRHLDGCSYSIASSSRH